MIETEKLGLFQSMWEDYVGAGRILEAGPMKYISEGYWEERHARKILSEIENFNTVINDNPGMDSTETAELIKETEKKLRSSRNNKEAIWGTLNTVFHTMAGIGILALCAKYDQNVLGALPLYVPVFANFGYPSVLRKQKELENNGNRDLLELFWTNGSERPEIDYFKQLNIGLYEKCGLSV